MSNELTTTAPRNALFIKNLCPGLMEVGKIKIGKKGNVRKSQSGADWQPPQKLDHFLITTMQRGEDGNYLQDDNLTKRFAPSGDPLRSIPVRLIYDDIALNFATRYICYYGKTVYCSGDGETALRLQSDKKTYATRTCTCGRQDPKYNGDNGPNGPDNVGGSNSKGKCKINGILSVIIDGADRVGGVWKFRTTSYNSVVGILSSLALIQRITGGRLAGIPMMMTVSPKTVQDPLEGKQQTIHIVGLQYAGTMDSLREVGYQIALTEAKHGISMARIEEDARMLLTHTPTAGLGDDIAEDVIEEFYPEEVVQPVPDLVDPSKRIHEINGDVTDKNTGAVIDRTPPLAGVSTEQQPRRERGKPSPGHKRRTNEEIETDRLADEADALVAQRVADNMSNGDETLDPSTGEIIGGPGLDDDFPDLPGTHTQPENKPTDDFW